jgi:hypothetical protein
MKLTIKTFAALICSIAVFAITNGIKTTADGRLRNAETVAAGVNRVILSQRQTLKDHESEIQAAAQAREFRRLTGQPAAVDVRIVK